jgi:hypothetical protein
MNGTTNAFIRSTTTNVAGNYLFTFLAPGTYRVRFYCPAGTVFTPPNLGGNSALDSDAIFTLVRMSTNNKKKNISEFDGFDISL